MRPPRPRRIVYRRSYFVETHSFSISSATPKRTGPMAGFRVLVRARARCMIRYEASMPKGVRYRS